MIITSSIFTFTNMTGSQNASPGMVSINNVNNNFLIFHNEGNAAGAPNATYGRYFIWDASARTFLSSSEFPNFGGNIIYSSSAGGFAGEAASFKSVWVSGSRYAVMYDNYNGGNGVRVSMIEATSSTQTVTWLATTPINPFNRDYPAHLVQLGTGSSKVGMIGVIDTSGEFAKVADFTSSVNPSIYASTINSKSPFNYNRTHWITWTGVENEFLAGGQSSSYASNYESYGNVFNITASMGNGVEFNTYIPRRYVPVDNYTTNVIRVTNDVMLVIEASSSNATASNGVWYNFLTRSGNTFTTMSTQQKLFSPPDTNKMTQTFVVPLSSITNTYGVISTRDDSVTYMTKIRVDPALYIVTELTPQLTMSAYVRWATRLNTDEVAVIDISPTIANLWSITFNAPDPAPAMPPYRAIIWGLGG